MRNLIVALFTLFFFTACSVSNLNQNSVSSKEELIKASQTGDIKAMLQLHEHYKFPQTKEGLYYFNKWYTNINKQHDPKDITAIAKVYDEYSKMFINENQKAQKLYKLASSLGDNSANIALIKSYLKNYQRDEAKALEEKIINSLNNEEMQELYSFYNKNYYSRQAKNLEKIMEKKGIELPTEAIIKNIRKYSYRKSDEEKLNELINKILEKNKSEDIYKLANLYYKKYKFEKAIPYYEKVLELDPKNINAILELGAIYNKGNYREKLKKNKDKAAVYFEKASKLDNSEATQSLLSIYSSDKKYLDKYFSLKQKLNDSKDGKLILAKFYKKQRQYPQAYKLFEEVAQKGNHEAIIELAMNRASSYRFNPEIHNQTKKWQDYIYNSKDKELKKKYIDKISSPYTKRYYKEELKKYSVNKLDTNNIIELREIYRAYKYKDKKLALEALTKAHNFGDVKSTYSLINYYKRDRKNKDFKKAVELLESLEQRGEKKATKELADLYYNPPYGFKEYKDKDKALKLYEKLAEQDDFRASRKLVDIYLCGKCENKKLNHKKAKYYLEKLVKRGYSYDIASLGWLYQYGEGVERDLLKAKELYEEAAQKGYNTANYYLAWLYYQDEESPKDSLLELNYKKALEYLKKGHQKRDYRATNLIGVFYEKGYGVKKDREKAVEYYKQAYKYDMFAAHHLGQYYYDIKEYEKALELYKKARKRGHKGSIVKLGIMYERGVLGKVDIQKALEYYKEAYNKYDDKVAAYNIGLVYHYGKGGIKKDKKLAKQWYEKANIKDSKKQLKLLK